jgi:antitoxin component YwqK of YwqJK toxin-antitoxin module
MKKLCFLIVPIALCACEKKYQLGSDAFYCDENGALIEEDQYLDPASYYFCDQSGKKITGSIAADQQMSYVVKDGLAIHKTLYYEEGKHFVEQDMGAALTGKPGNNMVFNTVEYYKSGNISYRDKKIGDCQASEKYSESNELIWSEFRCDSHVGIFAKKTFHKTSFGIVDFDIIFGQGKKSSWFATVRNEYDDMLRQKPVNGELIIYDESGEVAMKLNLRNGMLHGSQESFNERFTSGTIFINFTTATYKDGAEVEFYSKYESERVRWMGDDVPNLRFDEEKFKNGKFEYLHKGKLVGAGCDKGKVVVKDPEKVKCK